MNKLFHELKRRHVFRVAGVYILVSWLMIQAASLFEDAMNLPAWFDGVVLAFLLIGFPVAIVLAWAFDATPEGVRRTAPATEEDLLAASGRPIVDIALVIAMTAVVSVVIWQQSSTSGSVEATVDGLGSTSDTPTLVSTLLPSIEMVEAASIAVLPFVDLSPNGDQAHFSDGIAEEILNVLVGIDNLKVASRTSSFGYRGQEALGIPLIAEKLNVRHVLEGSVRKSGDTVRITAQLIDSGTDQHLWSETYDRKLTTENLFSIQDEIASAIVTALGTLIGDVADIELQADTEDLDAYEAFLAGRALLTVRNNQNLPTIMSTLEGVVAKDPGFARAWSDLAVAYSVAPSWGIRDRDFEGLARKAANKAIALNPNLSRPYAVLGGLAEDFVDKFDYFAKSLDRDPNEVNALQWRGESYVLTGFFGKAAESYRRCIEIDPDFLQCRVWLAKTEFFQGRQEEGFALFEDAVTRGAVGGGAFQYPLEYINAGRLSTGRVLLAEAAHRFSFFDGDTRTIFRALTKPGLDYQAEADAFAIAVTARTGTPPRWIPAIALAFKQYDKMTPGGEGNFWIRTDPEFLASPHRKRVIREAGVYDYWRKAGFPPQCRSVGVDDFECD